MRCLGHTSYLMRRRGFASFPAWLQRCLCSALALVKVAFVSLLLSQSTAPLSILDNIMTSASKSDLTSDLLFGLRYAAGSLRNASLRGLRGMDREARTDVSGFRRTMELRQTVQ